jgi:hypothetical protein
MKIKVKGWYRPSIRSRAQYKECVSRYGGSVGSYGWDSAVGFRANLSFEIDSPTDDYSSLDLQFDAENAALLRDFCDRFLKYVAKEKGKNDDGKERDTSSNSAV